MKLSKEQMFDFILKNYVTIMPSGCWCTRHDSQGNIIERFHIKYQVSINNSGMLGMDLEEAIQYYYDNMEINHEDN